MYHCKLSIEVFDHRDDPVRTLELIGSVEIDRKQYAFSKILDKEFLKSHFDLVWEDIGRLIKAKMLSDAKSK